MIWFPCRRLASLRLDDRDRHRSVAISARLLRLPSPFFLGAVILGSILHLGFGVPLQLPQWLLATSYVLIGWAIGLNFTSGILRHAVRALPQIVGSILR